MRVLNLTDGFEVGGGGVANYIQEICVLLAELGHDCAVCYGHGPMADHTGEPITRLPLSGGPGTRARAESLRSRVSAFRPDIILIHYVDDPELIEIPQGLAPTIGVVHAPYVTCPSDGRLFCKGDSICCLPASPLCLANMYWRRCSSVHNPLTAIRLYNRAIERLRLYRRFACIIAVSGYIRDILVQNGVPETHITVLYPHFTENCPVSEQRDPNLVVFAGRIEKEKGLQYLLPALAKTPSNLNLIVAGSGTHLQEYRGMAHTLGLGERVRFLGQITSAELMQYYDNCLCVVVPSVLPEAFSKVGVEALARGAPVIASRVGGIPEWLEHERSGLLVAPANVNALAEAIQHLAQDPLRAAEYGRYGREMVAKRFRAEDHAKLLVALMEKQIAKGISLLSG